MTSCRYLSTLIFLFPCVTTEQILWKCSACSFHIGRYCWLHLIFPPLRVLWVFLFPKTHFYLLILATDPLMATVAAFRRGDFTNPGSHWTIPAGLFHFVPTSFQDLRWLRRCSQLTPPTPPAITDQAGFGCTFRFTSFFPCLTNMLTKTWQKRLIPVGKRSGRVAA